MLRVQAQQVQLKVEEWLSAAATEARGLKSRRMSRPEMQSAVLVVVWVSLPWTSTSRASAAARPAQALVQPSAWAPPDASTQCHSNSARAMRPQGPGTNQDSDLTS